MCLVLTSLDAKELHRLKHLLFPDVFAGTERLDRASLPVKQDTVSDRQVSSVKETSLWVACFAILYIYVTCVLRVTARF